MDDFSIDRQELTGALISMEFGTGGRIQQLWASDPSAPDDSEEFQAWVSRWHEGQAHLAKGLKKK